MPVPYLACMLAVSQFYHLPPRVLPSIQVVEAGRPGTVSRNWNGTADDLADESRQEVLRFAASGFRDFTRIAASDPVMWRDIFLNNREALLEMLARFMEDAQAMSRAVRWGDAAYIEDMVERGRKIRRSLIELKQA